jgi:hypothetical protein
MAPADRPLTDREKVVLLFELELWRGLRDRLKADIRREYWAGRRGTVITPLRLLHRLALANIRAHEADLTSEGGQS